MGVAGFIVGIVVGLGVGSGSDEGQGVVGSLVGLGVVGAAGRTHLPDLPLLLLELLAFLDPLLLAAL